MKLKLLFTSILSLLMICLSYGRNADNLNKIISNINNEQHREDMMASISLGINSEDSLSIEQILKNRAGQTNVDEISNLLEGGLDTEDRYSRTPLTLAVECRYTDLVRALIEAGANVNLNQPLITAIGSNDDSVPDAELVMLLINTGADVDQTDRQDLKTALMQAVIFGDADIVEILIDYGADVNKKNSSGETALSIAKHRHSEQIVEILLANQATDSFEPIEAISPTLNALLNSERSKKMAKVREMLSADINSRDEQGRTVLIYAISKVDDFLGFPCDIFAELVKIQGIEINAQDDEGTTALMKAALNRNPSYTQMLLDAGAKVNMENNEEQTALGFAVFVNHVDVTRLLIAHGANVNATDEKGRTALDYATYRLKTSDNDEQTAEVQEIINMLIKGGAKNGKP